MYAIDKLEFSRCYDAAVIANNTTITTYAVDTSGCNCVSLLVSIGATDVAATAFKVQEADALSSATALTSGTDVSGGDYSVATLPSSTDDNTRWLVKVPITGSRKRYLDLTLTVGNATGAYLYAVWIKEPNVVPVSDAAKGLADALYVTG